jgi:hypothetical protein
MENYIIPHSFNNEAIFQLSEDAVIGGKHVPATYCNATQMCKANNKRWSNYAQNKSSIAYWEGLSLDTGIPVSSLVVEILGTPDGDPGLQGTWVHPDIAMDLSQWISVPFRIWANRSLRAIIVGDFNALNEEAKIIQSQLREQWQSIRNASKEAFWTLGDAIKHYVLKHPERSEKFRIHVFSNCQDCLNRGLFGKDASAIRQELGVKDLLRDHYGSVSLKRIDLIQSLAAASIVHRDVNPLDAVKSALDTFKFEIISYKD